MYKFKYNIFNFNNSKLDIKGNFNNKNKYDVNTECVIDFNPQTQIITPIINFDFLDSENNSYLVATFSCSININIIKENNANQISKEVILELFETLHILCLGFLTKANKEYQESQNVFLPFVDYSEIITENFILPETF